MDFAFLQELGLTRNEVKIYSALLSLGSASSGKITYECGLHRSRVYEGLGRLMEKGLVSSVKMGKITFFEAASSERILDVLEEQKTSVEKKIGEAQKWVPELNRFRETKPTAEAYILQGVEGFKAMRREVLKHAGAHPAKELLLLGAIAREPKVMPLFYEKWDRERRRAGITTRILYKQNVKGDIRTEYWDKRRFLPEHIANPAVINIYGDRVVNVLWKGNEPLCFVMINKDIADAYRKYFEMLWGLSEKG